MKAVTWTQVAQYIILIIAYLIPVVVLSAKKSRAFRSRRSCTARRSRRSRVWRRASAWHSPTSRPSPTPRAPLQPDGDVELLRADPLPDGRHGVAAAHPDALLHHAVGREARKSVAWSLFFIFLLYFTAPAYAAFAKLEVYQNVIGQPIASLPAWVSSWGSIGLVGAMRRRQRPDLRALQGSHRQRRRHPAALGVPPAHRRHRARHAGNRRPAVRDPAWSRPAASPPRSRPPTGCCSRSPTRSATTSTTR
jgi:hypothetical protein